MATIANLTDYKVGVCIVIAGQPYQIVWADFMRTAQRKPVMRTKLRQLITGQVLEQTFKAGDKTEVANLEHSEANFQYREGDEFHFMDNVTFDTFTFSREQIGDIGNYVKENTDVDVLLFNGKPVSVKIPPKVVLTVVEAPPGVKGDSASNVTKKVKLETGYEAAVPLFIKEGEKVRINTETGQYVERVNE